MTLLNPDHLLDQADRLAAPPDAGAPRQTDLRRAISCAYYGLFHAVVTEVADTFIGRARRDSAHYALVYRSVDHKSLRKICEEIRKPVLSDRYKKYEPRGGFGSDITTVATAVTELQEKRHSADYDPLYRVKQSDAVLLVSTGRIALTRLRNTTPARRKAFLTLIVFSPR